MPPAYYRIAALVELIDEPARTACKQILAQDRLLFQTVPGSTHNHQAWPGGYIDHIQEVLNIAVVLYAQLNELRPLPFTRSDALLALFLHDLEKPWAYELAADGALQRRGELSSKEAQQAFRLERLAAAGLELTELQSNALRYAEGELGDYTNKRRTMGPLAAFCHACDVLSARLWFDHPALEGDAWPGAGRFRD